MISQRFKEIFDQIYAYAYQMKAPARNEKGCMYRSPNGPCLIGSVISDAEATLGEGRGVGRNISDKRFTSLDWTNAEERRILLEIQVAHDVNSLYPNWHEQMMKRLNEIRELING